MVGDIADIAIPFVGGLGETIKGAKVVKYIGDIGEIADSSYDTIRFVRATDHAADFVDGGLDMARALDRTTDGFTISNRIMGNKIHNTFMGNGITIRGTRLRVDGLVEDVMKLYELKPYNISSARRAVKQILNYNDALGGGYKMFIVLY